MSTIDDGPYRGQDNNGREIVKPLGVDVSRRKHNGLTKGMIAVIVLSSFTAFVICLGVVWLLLVKFSSHMRQPRHTPPALVSSLDKSTGTTYEFV